MARHSALAGSTGRGDNVEKCQEIPIVTENSDCLWATICLQSVPVVIGVRHLPSGKLRGKLLCAHLTTITTVKVGEAQLQLRCIHRIRIQGNQADGMQEANEMGYISRYSSTVKDLLGGRLEFILERHSHNKS
ncbi:uncharacterized protein LOC113495086 [Trichoplusia ni]|uniref:Uncharacterized protein LOC113495086 n=1 Tax=Trichoplusia ni TaxID=7111 RepID=A0A7E5VMH8_TRINI|nr:uncharacterized protein LOC113495086 [Trichoplusia ni]